MSTTRHELLLTGQGAASGQKPISAAVDGNGRAVAVISVIIGLGGNRIAGASGHGDATAALTRKRSLTFPTPAMSGHGNATASLRADVQWAGPTLLSAHGDATATIGVIHTRAVAAAATAHGDATSVTGRKRRITIQFAEGHGDVSAVQLGAKVPITAAATSHGDSAVTIGRKRAVKVGGATGRGDATISVSIIIRLDGTRIAGASGHGDVAQVTARRLRAIKASLTAHGDAVAVIERGGLKIIAVTGASGHGDATGALAQKLPLVAAGASGHGDTASATLGIGHLRLIGFPNPTGHGDATGALGVNVPISAAASGHGDATGALAAKVPLPASAATGHGDATAEPHVLIGLTGTRIQGASGHGDTSAVIQKTGLKILNSATVGVAVGHGDTTTATLRLALKVILAETTGTGASSAVIQINGMTTLWSAGFSPKYITQFDPAWWHPSVVHSHTVLLEFTGGTEVRARLRYKTVGADPAVDANWTFVPGSEVILSSVMNVATEVASGACTFPAGEKDYRTEVGKVGGSTGACHRGRLKHVSG